MKLSQKNTFYICVLLNLDFFFPLYAKCESFSCSLSPVRFHLSLCHPIILLLSAGVPSSVMSVLNWHRKCPFLRFHNSVVIQSVSPTSSSISLVFRHNLEALLSVQGRFLLAIDFYLPWIKMWWVIKYFDFFLKVMWLSTFDGFFGCFSNKYLNVVLRFNNINLTVVI